MDQCSQRLKRERGRRASGLSGWLAGPAGRWWENTRDAAERAAMLGRGGSGDFGPGEWHRWAKRGVREGEKNGPVLACSSWAARCRCGPSWFGFGLGSFSNSISISSPFSISNSNNV